MRTGKQSTVRFFIAMVMMALMCASHATALSGRIEQGVTHRGISALTASLGAHTRAAASASAAAAGGSRECTNGMDVSGGFVDADAWRASCTAQLAGSFADHAAASSDEVVGRADVLLQLLVDGRHAATPATAALLQVGSGRVSLNPFKWGESAEEEEGEGALGRLATDLGSMDAAEFEGPAAAENENAATRYVGSFLFGVVNGVLMGMGDMFRDAINDASCAAVWQRVSVSQRQLKSSVLSWIRGYGSAEARQGMNVFRWTWKSLGEMKTALVDFLSTLFSAVRSCEPLWNVLSTLVIMLVVVLVVVMAFMLIGAWAGAVMKIGMFVMTIVFLIPFLHDQAKKLLAAVRSPARGVDRTARIIEHSTTIVAGLFGGFALSGYADVMKVTGPRITALLSKPALLGKVRVNVNSKLVTDLKSFGGTLEKMRAGLRSGGEKLTQAKASVSRFLSRAKGETVAVSKAAGDDVAKVTDNAAAQADEATVAALDDAQRSAKASDEAAEKAATKRKELEDFARKCAETPMLLQGQASNSCDLQMRKRLQEQWLLAEKDAARKAVKAAESEVSSFKGLLNQAELESQSVTIESIRRARAEAIPKHRASLDEATKVLDEATARLKRLEENPPSMPEELLNKAASGPDAALRNEVRSKWIEAEIARTKKRLEPTAYDEQLSKKSGELWELEKWHRNGDMPRDLANRRANIDSQVSANVDKATEARAYLRRLEADDPALLPKDKLDELVNRHKLQQTVEVEKGVTQKAIDDLAAKIERAKASRKAGEDDWNLEGYIDRLKREHSGLVEAKQTQEALRRANGAAEHPLNPILNHEARIARNLETMPYNAAKSDTWRSMMDAIDEIRSLTDRIKKYPDSRDVPQWRSELVAAEAKKVEAYQRVRRISDKFQGRMRDLPFKGIEHADEGKTMLTEVLDLARKQADEAKQLRASATAEKADEAARIEYQVEDLLKRVQRVSKEYGDDAMNSVNRNSMPTSKHYDLLDEMNKLQREAAKTLDEMKEAAKKAPEPPKVAGRYKSVNEWSNWVESDLARQRELITKIEQHLAAGDTASAKPLWESVQHITRTNVKDFNAAKAAGFTEDMRGVVGNIKTGINEFKAAKARFGSSI